MVGAGVGNPASIGYFEALALPARRNSLEAEPGNKEPVAGDWWDNWDFAAMELGSPLVPDFAPMALGCYLAVPDFVPMALGCYLPVPDFVPMVLGYWSAADSASRILGRYLAVVGIAALDFVYSDPDFQNWL